MIWIPVSCVTAAVVGWLLCTLDKPIVIRIPFLRFFMIAGFAVFPFVFVDSVFCGPRLLGHEGKHWEHQRTAAVYLLGLNGVALWLVAYLFLLPIAWNPLRRWTERAALREEGVSMIGADKILRRFPYCLWF